MPAVEVPTWTNGRGCVGVINHVLQRPVPKEGHLLGDKSSPLPSDHRPVVWDLLDVRDPEDRPRSTLSARHFQIRDRCVKKIYHSVLGAARQERAGQPEGSGDLYAYFLATIIQAVKRAHCPPREFEELPGRVDQVHHQLQARGRWCCLCGIHTGVGIA